MGCGAALRKELLDMWKPADKLGCLLCDCEEGSWFFHDISSRGIVPFSHRGDKANAISLCKRCHDGFDSVRPQVIILPVDLQYFLDIEEQDFREQSENAQGTIRRRLLPSGDQYRAHLLNSRPTCVEEKYLNDLEDSDLPGGLYQAYIREDILGTRQHPIPLGKYDEPRIWHGSPTAIIVHELQALACVDDTKWISEETLDTLYAIARAWRKEPFLDDNGIVPQAVDQTVASNFGTSESVSTRAVYRNRNRRINRRQGLGVIHRR